VTAPPASPCRWRGGPLRRPATRFPGGVDGPRRESRTRECGGGTFWSAQVDRWPKAFVPIEIGLPRRCAPGVGLRRRKRHPPGRRRSTVGRRPLEAEFIRRAGRRPKAPCRLKSAFKGAARRASAFADAKDTFPVGAGRPLAEGPWGPNAFGAHADRWPKAFAPIEIGLPGRSRARRRPPPTQRALFRSAQADRWPKAPGGRMHSAHTPTVGRRLSCRLKSAFQGADAPSVGLRRRKERFSGRRRPIVGRRPLEAEFIRRAGRLVAGGFRAD